MFVRPLFLTILTFCLFYSPLNSIAQAGQTSSYVRFEQGSAIKFGLLNGDKISVLSGGLFPMSKPTGEVVGLATVKLLPPTDAGKVFAVGMNFASHLASRASGAPPLFLKLPSSLIGDRQDIHLPSDANNVHFEGELVIVIGKRAKNIDLDRASDYIFGVTAGNDLTERSWQGQDLQWMRAKASDGFGPVGPAVVTGVDYNDVLLTTRLNDKIVQQENTRNMIHKPSKVVSYLSRYFTLEAGDMIFMGTPGRTKALNDGDIVSVEIEGVGKISNRIVR